MERIKHEDLMEAGVHFGHLRKKWNPKMRPYIFAERKGIHIIDLNKTEEMLFEAANAMKGIIKSGKKVLFVATKKQAKDVVEKCAQQLGMPYVTERWLGGMLTNFSTIRKSVKKMQSIEKMISDTNTNITKKEKLMLAREKAKLEKVLGGVAQLSRLPSALYLVDIMHEHIALAEAKRLNIPTFAMVDTNSDPTTVDYAIAANDDATKSITVITEYLTAAMNEGNEERKLEKLETDSSGKDSEEAETEEEMDEAEEASEELPNEETVVLPDSEPTEEAKAE